MSPTTWTPTAVSSEAIRFAGKAWRVVEDQHRSSTIKLVDTLAEHETLEQILESGKPPLPLIATHLHYLLAGPFRYPPSPVGSRFRGSADPGVFYAALTFRTAAIELGYWRWKFLCQSSGLTRLAAAPQTVFKADVKAQRCINLMPAPFNRDAVVWEHPTDYSGTQEFARVARSAAIEALVYQSVRDTSPGECIALLGVTAFGTTKPDNDTKTWHLTVTQDEVIWTHTFKASFSVPTSGWPRP
jgi:hypothetical protein